jgi:hypothetical protein
MKQQPRQHHLDRGRFQGGTMTIGAQARITLVLCSLSALAAGENLNIKPGLWDFTTVAKGNMMPTAEKAEMEKAMAEMPPEQRAKTEAYLKSMQAGTATRHKGCVTKESITKMSTFIVPGEDSGCKRTEIKTTSTIWEFREECAGSKGKTGGTVRVVAPNPETYTLEWTPGAGWEGSGSWKMSAKWLGADCGNVKP